ncbi:hypothetical protein OAO55_00685 [Bacteroidales bacterium]|nr:hypothetical protein [Bacteroidales bacterium]
MGYSKESIMPNEATGNYKWVCIPATESKKHRITGEIPERLTEASSFYIIDVKKNVYNTIPANKINDLLKDNEALRSSGISHIITRSVSTMAAKVLKSNNIKLMQAESNDVFENIMLMKTKKLKMVNIRKLKNSSISN